MKAVQFKADGWWVENDGEARRLSDEQVALMKAALRGAFQRDEVSKIPERSLVQVGATPEDLAQRLGWEIEKVQRVAAELSVLGVLAAHERPKAH